ncbi:hypothetical protein D3C72_844490 [compost metagenome]
MLKKLITVLLAVTPLTAGCHTAAPTLPAAPAAAPAKALTAPRLVDNAKLRRVLQTADGGMSLFGISFSQSLYTYWDRNGTTESWNTNMQFSGKGELIKASRNRFIYEVPENQVLVLNQTQGKGQILLNNYGYSVPQAAMSYLFGPGETVVFTFYPNQSWGASYQNSASYTFDSLGISGYTGSPELMGKLGLAKGK